MCHEITAAIISSGLSIGFTATPQPRSHAAAPGGRAPRRARRHARATPGAGLTSLALLALLAGCAGGAQRGGPARSGPGQAEAPAPVAHDGHVSEAAGTTSAPAAPAGLAGDAAAPGAYDSGAGHAARGQGAPMRPPVEQEQPRERPGLGTVFGETRASGVHMTRFARATADPFAAMVLHYNDEEGVRAHASYLGQGGLAPYRFPTDGGGISVALVGEHGDLLPGGEAGGKRFVVGHAGQRYEILVHNQTGGRFEVVASVDGLDVIDGEPAHVDKRGYVLEPYATVRIDGWRRSQEVVAAFRFGRVSDSYAGRTAGDRNVGVIGLAFFAEQGGRWTTDELWRRDTADPFPAERGYAQPPGY